MTQVRRCQWKHTVNSKAIFEVNYNSYYLFHKIKTYKIFYSFTLVNNFLFLPFQTVYLLFLFCFFILTRTSNAYKDEKAGMRGTNLALFLILESSFSPLSMMQFIGFCRFSLLSWSNSPLVQVCVKVYLFILNTGGVLNFAYWCGRIH